MMPSVPYVSDGSSSRLENSYSVLVGKDGPGWVLLHKIRVKFYASYA